jgi:hypothetical protein
LIYLYVGLGMAMLLPIMVGLQTAVSVTELEQGEFSFQREGGKILRDWEDRLCLKADPNAACNNAPRPKGYAVRSFTIGNENKSCFVPDNPDSIEKKCLQEYEAN